METPEKIRLAIEQVKKTGVTVRVNNSIVIKKLNDEIHIVDEKIKYDQHNTKRIDTITDIREGNKNGRIS